MNGTDCGAAAKPWQDGADQQTTGSSCADLEDKTPTDLPLDHSGRWSMRPSSQRAAMALRTQARSGKSWLLLVDIDDVVLRQPLRARP
jgi:hypothetical protein